MILANAKTNPFLAITGRYTGNYHELISLNVPNDIYDHITISESDHWSFECNDNTLLKNNTIHRVVEQLQPLLTKKYCIKLEKDIPQLSGFGGGSSDATAILKFFNAKENLKLNHEKLVEIAKNIGADCPFFIQNRPAIVSGIGDIISPLDEHVVQHLKKYQMIIFKPPFGMETKLAYQKLRTTHTRLYIPYSKATKLMNNLIQEILDFSPKLSLFNTFSDIIFSKHGELRILKKKLEHMNVNLVLSGSGSGCSCLFKDPSQATHIVDIIKDHFKQEIFIRKTAII